MDVLLIPLLAEEQSVTHFDARKCKFPRRVIRLVPKTKKERKRIQAIK